MTYVAAKTTIPLPRVHAYSLNSDNLINSPYLVMDYIEGKPLHDLGFQRGHRTPASVVKKVHQQISNIYLQLRQLEFPAIGALGLAQSASEPLNTCSPDKMVVSGRPITMDMALQERAGYRPGRVIKPGTTFHSAGEFVNALVALSVNQLDKTRDAGSNQQQARELLYTRYAFYGFAFEELAPCNGPFVLIHGDLLLHDNNILFDHDFNLVAVIDWEWSFVAPLEFLVPPVWLIGSGISMVLACSEWFNAEVQALQHQIGKLEQARRQLSLLRSSWVSTATARGAVTIAALLHPEKIEEVFWGSLFWHIQGINQLDPDFDVSEYLEKNMTHLIDDYKVSEKLQKVITRQVCL
ncbi:hypothetical protein F66182_7587 [Fusarium sp. NRRL 66182]|nr:hypothetical protein F66182_7587 [Fusarium sp. NRRL 66182]